MSSSGAIRAGRAFIELFAEKGRLGPTLREAGATVAGWAEKVNKSGARLAGLAEGLTPLSQRSGDIADQLDRVGGAFGGAAGKLSPMARGLQTISGSAGKVVEGLKNNATAMAGFSLASKGAEYLPMLLTGLISPAGLAAVAVAGLGYAFVKYTDSGKEGFGQLMSFLVSLKDEALATFGAISNAIEAGDLAAAWDVLTSTLKVAWETAVVFLLEKFGDFRNQVNHIAVDAFYGILETANNVWAAMRQGWEDFVNWFTDKWKAAQLSIAKVSVDIMAYFDKSIDAEDAKGILKEEAGAAKQKRDSAHKAAKSQIEKDRQAREDALAQGNIDANKGVDAYTAAELEEHKAALAKARAARAAAIDKANGLKPRGTGAAVAEQAAAESAKKTEALSGLGGEDVRTSGGFGAVLKSLQQGQDPMVGLTQKQLDLQNQQLFYERRTSDALDKITVRSI